MRLGTKRYWLVPQHRSCYSQAVGSLKGKERLRPDGGRDARGQLSAAGCFPRSKANRQSSPKQKLLGSVSPSPFSSSPSALSHNNHAFTHLLNNRALSPCSSSSPVPSPGETQMAKEQPQPSKGLLCSTRQDSNCCATFSKTKRQNRCFSIWHGTGTTTESRTA